MYSIIAIQLLHLPSLKAELLESHLCQYLYWYNITGTDMRDSSEIADSWNE